MSDVERFGYPQNNGAKEIWQTPIQEANKVSSMNLEEINSFLSLLPDPSDSEPISDESFSFESTQSLQDLNSQVMSLEELDNLLNLLPSMDLSLSQASYDDTVSVMQEQKKERVIEPQTEKIIKQIDSLLGDLNQAIDGTVNEVRGWNVERKRLEAKQSKDPFTLEILVADENPIIKTLALCNPNISTDFLRRAGRGDNQWFQMIAANNASTPGEVLDELGISEVPDITQGVKQNSNTSPVTLYKLHQEK
jgi:hypothetical protein